MKPFLTSLLICALTTQVAISAENLITKQTLTYDDAATVLTNKLNKVAAIRTITRRDHTTLIVQFEDETETTVNLGNLLLILNNEPDIREQNIQLYVDLVKNIASASDPTKEQLAQNLLPAIRQSDYVQYMEETGLQMPVKNYFFKKNIGADYWIVLALDGQGSITFPTKKSLEPLELDEDQLLSLAIDNFKNRLLEKVTVSKEEGVFIVSIDGFYDASILISDDFWSNQAKELGSEIVMVAPARDLVMFAPKSDKDTTEFMISFARDNISQFSHALSDQPLLWTQDGWREFKQ